jgi:hypothetical protein
LIDTTGSKRGSVSTSSSNLSLVARIEMSGGWIFRPVGAPTTILAKRAHSPWGLTPGRLRPSLDA